MELICVKGVATSGLVMDDGLSINKELCVLEGTDIALCSSCQDAYRNDNDEDHTIGINI